MNKNYKLKLKHLSCISKDPVDYKTIMKEVCNYKNRRLGRKLVFKYKLKQAHEVIKRYINLNPLDVKYVDCNILKPKNIDYITFKAMMELQYCISNLNKEDIVNNIAHIISIVCFQENNVGEDYESNTIEFLKFRDKILNEDLEQMFGIYNWIVKSLEESEKMWEERFLSVKVIDKEYEQAGGDRMSQFNILTTIKNICNDLNVSYHEAWQIPYTITQNNSYSKATYNRIQDDVRQIKESKMIRSRENQK